MMGDLFDSPWKLLIIALPRPSACSPNYRPSPARHPLRRPRHYAGAPAVHIEGILTIRCRGELSLALSGEEACQQTGRVMATYAMSNRIALVTDVPRGSDWRSSPGWPGG